MTQERKTASDPRREVAADGDAVPKRRGRPPGKAGRPPKRTRQQYNLSLAIEIVEWLKDHPDGPATVADRALRKEMELEKKQ